MYGLDLELCSMTTQEEDYIKVCETNIIKFTLNLNHRNGHTALLFALDLINFDSYINICKLKLFI